MKLTFIFPVAWLLFTGCNNTSPQVSLDKPAATDEIRQTFANYFGDIKNSGLSAELAYLDSSPDFFWIPPGYSHALSYDSVVSILLGSKDKFQQIENSIKTLSIQPLATNFATYHAILDSKVTDTSGITSTTRLIESGTLIKRSGKWNLLNGQTRIVEN